MLFRSVLIVILAATVAAIIAARLDTGGDNASPATTPAGPAPPFGRGPVAPGLYDFAVFNPRLSLVFGDGWTALFPPDDDEIALDGPVFLLISRPSQVVEPDTQQFVPLPDDVIAWVGTHKTLEADDPVATTLGGREAFRIDATAREGTKIFGFNAADAILVAKGDRMRLIAADVEGATVAALMIAPAPRFDEAVAAGQALLDTLRFEGGEGTPAPTGGGA